MITPENRNELCRARIVAYDDHMHEPIFLATPWHRHDDLEQLTRETDTLVRTYMSFPGISSVTTIYEYKPYRRT